MITLDALPNIASPAGPTHALLLHGRMIGGDRTVAELRALKVAIEQIAAKSGLPVTLATTLGWPADAVSGDRAVEHTLGAR